MPEKITSINLSCIPFIGSCDSTRTQMVSKQIAQALTHTNCEIPYVISENYHDLVENSNIGILKAESSGKIIFKNEFILIVHYPKIDKFKIYEIPQIKKTTGTYCSELRSCLNKDDNFEKDDIIYEYDCFRSGIPSFGQNIFTGYFAFMGFNHEDSIIVSESFVNRFKYKLKENINIPIYDYTLLQSLYKDENSLIYLPKIGQKIKGDTICNIISSKDKNDLNLDPKRRIISYLKKMSISNLINLYNIDSTKFSITPITTKIENGILTKIKIHKVELTPKLIDSNLQKVLESLFLEYFNKVIVKTYKELEVVFGPKFAKYILAKYIVYKNKYTATKIGKYKNASYILELEISGEYSSSIGDKFTNSHAGKGVISCIIPDELRPIAIDSDKPIDLILNPFGSYSRMNWSQFLEILFSKTIQHFDERIKNGEDPVQIIEWINEELITKIFPNNPEYYKNINSLVENMKKDETVKEKFIDNIKKNNLFIEVPSFGIIDIKDITNKNIDTKENILLKKELIDFMLKKIDLKIPFETSDVYLEPMFCGPAYISKLNKLVDHIISARDLGMVKAITQQPLRGRRVGGGAKLGYLILAQIKLL